jgi:hypothetical protein
MPNGPKLHRQELKWNNVDLSKPDELKKFLSEEVERVGIRIGSEITRLREAGILDANGRRLKTALPPDMEEDSQCTVGE